MEHQVGDLRFRWHIEDDLAYGTPWDEEDGRGVVTRLFTPKALGGGWYFDEPATLARAREQSWGLPEAMLPALAKRLGRVPTPDDILTEAVRIEFEALRGYLRGDWGYVGIIVTLLNLDGDPTPIRESVWGIDSLSTDYHAQVAHDLAEQIAAQYPTTTQVTVGAVTHQIRPKPERPWNPDVYTLVRASLRQTGATAKGAHREACRYAKRQGTTEELVAAFNRDRT